MAKSKKKAPEGSKYYTKLIIYRGRQFSLLLVVLGYIAGFTVLIFNDISAEEHWVTMAIPLVISGLMFILFPPTEEWEYKAWQNSPQQVEQHRNN